MPAKILRTVLTFAAVVVAYQVYVLLAVPYLEPTLEVREQRRSTAAERAGGRKLVDKYQRLLAAYFPADHWTQKRAPKIIKNGPGMLVLDEYKQQDGNHIELVRCALLFFPTPLQDGMNPPADAIVVEAPQGASILFDDDFNPAGGELGEIIGGQLNGLVTIRSEMKQTGTEDDLFVQTSNLRLNGDRLETPDAVQFRLGPNQGQGTRLQIHLLSEDNGGSSSTGIQFSGIRSISVLENVECRFALDANLLSDTGAQPTQRDGPSSSEPIQIRCTGPFEFQLLGDEKDYVATFNDNVEVWQFNPTGTSDQMVCNKLSLEFLPEYSAGVEQPLEVSRRQRTELGRLEPYLLKAVGEPVIMMSPSRKVEARGAEVTITIPERKIALESNGGDVQLRSGVNVVRAPAIFYTHPADNAGTRLGSFHADGAGSLEFEPNPNKPNEVLHVHWQESVQLTREEGEPVLSINGQPHLAMPGRGELSADSMKVYLREIADDSTDTQPAEDSLWVFSGGDEGNKDKQSTTVVPDRLTALGNVVINSPQLSGETHSLSAWFRYLPDEEPKGNSDSDDGFGLPGGNASGESYAIKAEQLQLEIALRGRRAEPMNLTCVGNVEFRETRPANPADVPLVLHGQRLIVSDIDSDAKRIAIHGDPGGGNQPARPAELTARGMTLISPAVFLDEGANRVWIDGAGEAHVNMNRDLSGKQSAQPYSVKIRWQDGLNFNGKQVAVDGDVFIEGPENWLRCDQLIGTLTRKIEFGEGTGGIKPDVAEINVRGNVVIDQRERDAGGPTAHHRMELEQLSVNQQTGAIRGSGPGWLRSVHYGQQLDSLTQPGAVGSVAPATEKSSLHFLRVGFVRGLTGNLHDRVLTFQQRVQTVYGPVDSWEQELDINRPETLPPSAITLRSSELTVNEDPTARLAGGGRAGQGAIGKLGGGFGNGFGSGSMGPIELTAIGNVDIEGTAGDQQKFKAVANRASYSQRKDVFDLQGDGRIDARIYLWQQPGTEPQGLSARSILYNRTTGAIDFDGVKGMNYTPVPGVYAVPNAARNPAQGRIR